MKLDDSDAGIVVIEGTPAFVCVPSANSTPDKVGVATTETSFPLTEIFVPAVIVPDPEN